MMKLDLAIVVAYFAVIFWIGFRSRVKKALGPEEYFLSSRSLRWPSIAVSTIATNISAGHFMGMAGSAYLYGLAQANFEINAIFGILMAAFFFVPLYLRSRVITISQFFELRLGPGAALTYSVLMMLMFSSLYLGSTLFWGAYAIEGVFSDAVAPLSDNPVVRLGILVVALGTFSAAYTYMGGLRAVVRTDMVQFVLFVVGGIIMLWFSLDRLGGWSNLYQTGLPGGVGVGDLSPHRMHLHLPDYHEKLPWIGILGMNLLNLNYWGANQVILQRALAAKNLWHAQVGLLVGGLIKYLMVLIIIIPGIALAGILQDNPLDDPDQAYMTMVKTLLPVGLGGLILCGLFASLMSTVDSIFNSVSTLWSIDIYKRHLRPEATDAAVVRTGRFAIVATLATGIAFAFVQIYVKFANPHFALTHWFNETSYYVKNGFVVLIMAAVFLVRPPRKLVLGAVAASIVMYFSGKLLFPDMNYLVRSAWVILISFFTVAVPTILKNGWRIPLDRLLEFSSKRVTGFGIVLFGSLVACHIIFH